MFIIEPIKKEVATGELKLMYKIIERSLGFVPPHFELFATIDLNGMKKFLEDNQYIMNHAKIDKNLLPYLRLYIAKKECGKYCINFNTQLLKKMEVDSNIIENLDTNIENIPFNIEQKMLLLKVFKAIYKADEFNKKDLEELYTHDFSDKDFFDLLSYASNFMSKSKLIEVYLK